VKPLNVATAITGSATAAVLWRLSRPTRTVSHTEGAGRVIDNAPDPTASYLPENRPIDADAARELRRMVTGS
jgi:hypothetical protein